MSLVVVISYPNHDHDHNQMLEKVYVKLKAEPRHLNLKINLKIHARALKQTLVRSVRSGWQTNVPTHHQPIPCFSSL